MTRKEFREKYLVVYGTDVPDSTTALLKKAEAVRDLAMHGKASSDDQKRNAIANVLAYAEALNEHVRQKGGPKPFGDLRGFRGPGESLEAGHRVGF